MSHNASGIFVRSDDLAMVVAVARQHLASTPPDVDEDEGDDAGGDDGHALVLLEPWDGWVHVVGRDRYTFDLDLARALAGALDAEVVGYEVQGCNLCFRLARLRGDEVVERACSPEGLFDPATLAEREEGGPVRFRDVEDLAERWLLDLGVPSSRLFVLQPDLDAPPEEPADAVAGVSLDVEDGVVTEARFEGRLGHQGEPRLRPDVFMPGVIMEMFALPIELDDEGAASLLRVFDRRARRYLLATGAQVRFMVAGELKARLRALLGRPGAAPATFTIAG